MAGRLLPAATTSLGLLATPALVAGITLILGGVALGTTGPGARP